MNHKNRSFTATFKRFLIYILVTLIPSVSLSYFLSEKKLADIENQYKGRAQWYANFHATNIDHFIGETVGRLEMLATLIHVQPDNIENIEQILKETQGKDPRFSGFYWANPNGDLINSSVPLSSPVNVSDREYFQEALSYRRTTISTAHIGRVTGRYIITIATPVLDRGQVKGVLLASLRIDEIKDNLMSRINRESIVVTDSEDQVLIDTRFDSNNQDENTVKSSTAVTHVPWITTAFITPEEDDSYTNAFLEYFIILFTITNIFFLFILHLLLRRNIKREKEQTEVHKLELIGNLAASTAHEIRNPLTGISGLVRLLSEDFKDQKAQYYFHVIQEEINRINNIVSELLVLGKPSITTLKTCDANDIVKEIEPIIHSEANYMNVQLEINYHSETLPILCVKDQLKQVILNLAKNSLHAMPNGGKLSISLEEQSKACIISVEDNGSGIPKEQLTQVFNPFFTMKKDGSGLGLTVCKRIIESFNGTIHIDSHVNVGTRVEIRIPLTFDEENV